MRKRNTPSWPKPGMTIQAMFSGRIYKVIEVLPGTKEGDTGTIKCTRDGEPCILKINPHIYKEV